MSAAGSTAATPSPTDSAAVTRRSDRPSSGAWVLVVGSLLVALVRGWATRRAEFPFIVADETAYLSMADFMGGGGGWSLGRSATYGPAYSVLIAPWTALGWSPDAVYRAAILTNVVLAVGAFLVLERLVRRLTALERPWSAVVALIGVSTPSQVLMAGYAWSDPLAVLAFLVLVAASIQVVERPDASRAVLVAAAAVGAFAVHGRFAPAVLVVLVLLVLSWWRRGLTSSALGAAVALLVVGSGAVVLASGALYDQLYVPGGQVHNTTNSFGRLLSPGPLTLSGVGQLWYLLATTAGLVGFGAIALVLAARPRRTFRPDPVVPVDAARVIVALVLVCFGASVGFMAGREGAHHLVYGRYNDAFVALLIAIGLAHLASVPSIGRMLLEAVAVTAATASSGALIWWKREDLLRTPPNGITIRSLLALGPGNTRVVPHHTLVATVVVVAVILLALAMRRRPEVLLLGVAGLAAVGLHRGLAETTGPRSGDPRSAAVLDTLVDPGDQVAYHLEPGRSVGGFFRYPFYAEDLRMYWTSAAVWRQGVPWIMAPPDHAEIRAAGYDLLWEDPGGSNGLWHLPGS